MKYTSNANNGITVFNGKEKEEAGNKIQEK